MTSRWSASFCRMPRMSRVIDEKGHESELDRIHDAGLFAGRAAQRLASAISVRARFGERRGRARGSLPLPAGAVGFRSLSSRRRHASASLREAWRASDGAGRRRRRRLRRLRAERQARQRGGRLQFLGRPAPRHARARQRLLGNLCARRAASATTTNTRSSDRTAACCR